MSPEFMDGMMVMMAKHTPTEQIISELEKDLKQYKSSNFSDKKAESGVMFWSMIFQMKHAYEKKDMFEAMKEIEQSRRGFEMLNTKGKEN